MPRRKKSPVNRSQAIRDYLAKNGKAPNAEIKEALGKDGLKVSDSLISAVKYKKPKGKRGRKRGRPAKATNGAATKISIDTLVAAKQFIERAGGIEAATAAIGVLGKLRG